MSYRPYGTVEGAQTERGSLSRSLPPWSARKSAVQPSSRLPVSSPNITTNPEPIPTRLNKTCTRVNVEVVIPKIMMCVLPKQDVPHAHGDTFIQLFGQIPGIALASGALGSETSRRNRTARLAFREKAGKGSLVSSLSRFLRSGLEATVGELPR